MSDELVRVRTATGFETTVGRVHAQASSDLTILDDEPVREMFGRTQPITRAGGRPLKPKTTVAKKAADRKAAAAPAAATEAVTASADNERNSK